MSERTLIGVDLGGTKVRAGRIAGQEIVGLDTRTVSSQAAQDTVIQEIVAAIDKVRNGAPAGIGIGVPSVVDVEQGIVYAVENIPSWQHVPLKEILERQYGVPVFVNNDANCFALGELHFGQGQGYRHLVGLTVGTGLGAGIIINGKLYCGSNCGAGEIGAIPYRDHTIEYYCSGQRFRREHGIDGAQLFERARCGNRAAVESFAAFGGELAHAVMTVLYAYDPEIIVLGGSVSRAFEFFEPALQEKLRAYAYQHVLERVRIEASRTAEIAVLGAAALCLEQSQ